MCLSDPKSGPTFVKIGFNYFYVTFNEFWSLGRGINSVKISQKTKVKHLNYY